LILFSPDKNSVWCTQAPKLGEKAPDCSAKAWTVEVEPAFYEVEITMGDSEIMARYDLQINGVTVVDRFLKVNDYLTVKLPKVNALEGKLHLTAECP